MGIPGYTSIEEMEYLHGRLLPMPYFAPGELTKIENYDIARSEGFYGWHIHHRLGESSPRWKLIEDNRYYNRPAEELIFLTASMHRQQHQSSRTHNLEPMANPAYIRAIHRYRRLLTSLSNGESLTYTDELFLEEFCRRMGKVLPDGLKRKSGVARVANNREICLELIAGGLLELETRIQQRNRIIRVLRRIGKDTPSYVRAIERMLTLDKKLLAMNDGVAILLPYTLDERKMLCANSYARSTKDRSLQRVRILQDKLSNGGALTAAERVFKSRHKELFK